MRHVYEETGGGAWREREQDSYLHLAEGKRIGMMKRLTRYIPVEIRN